jgi:hypothetical protein
MAEAIVLSGLRSREVLGLRPGDLQVAQRRVPIAEGKDGHRRLVAVSGRRWSVGCVRSDSGKV